MMMVMMVIMMPAVTAMRELDRLQVDIGNAGRNVQPGLALHAERLQRVGILRTADQEVAAASDPYRRVGADPAVVARELAAPNPAARCVHRPGKLGLLGEAEIDAKPADGRDVGLGRASVAFEHALEAGDGADDEADILAALALQDTGTNRRQRVGACDRQHARGRGNTSNRKSRE